MMAQNHPSDIELLELAEGELDEQAASEVRAHLAVCETCAREVEAAVRARELLRASPLLELPPERLGEIVSALPEQERDLAARRSFLRSRKGILAVLTPAAIATVAVVVAVIATRGGPPDQEATEATVAIAQTAPPEAEAGDAATESLQAAPAEEAARQLVLRVAGPPREVAQLLREAGYDATVTDGSVEVSGATPAEVEQALESRPAGDVPVFAVP